MSWCSWYNRGANTSGTRSRGKSANEQKWTVIEIIMLCQHGPVIHVYLYTTLFILVHTHTHTHRYVCMYVCMYVTYVCRFTCTLYVHVYLYVMWTTTSCRTKLIKHTRNTNDTEQGHASANHTPSYTCMPASNMQYSIVQYSHCTHVQLLYWVAASLNLKCMLNDTSECDSTHVLYKAVMCYIWHLAKRFI